MDTYSMHEGYSIPAVVTGKPLSIGGSEGRNDATATGVLFVTRQAAKHIGMPLKGARVSVQGYGNAGSIAARLFHEEGCKIVAVSDTRGGIYNEPGFYPGDCAALQAGAWQRGWFPWGTVGSRAGCPGSAV